MKEKRAQEKSRGSRRSKSPISKNQVSFSKIQIREYERSVGDNVPTKGVPMTLGWNYNEVDELELSDHDAVRRYRSHDELKLPNHIRMEILTKFGYSVDEQVEALEEANVIRQSRKASAAATPRRDRAEYQLEKAKKTVKKYQKNRSLSPVRQEKEQFNEEIAQLIDQDRMRTGRAPVARSDSYGTKKRRQTRKFSMD